MRKSKDTSNVKKPKAKSEAKFTHVKISVLIIALILFIGLVVWSVYSLYKNMFHENIRFTLRRVSINSNGYWANKNQEVIKSLNLNLHKDNLFKISLKDLKSQANNLAGIESCKVIRVLPDTLRFDLIERVPRAQINNHPGFVVDAQGVIIPRSKSMPITGNLPYLLGVSKNFRFEANAKIKEFLPALKLLMIVLEDFPNLSLMTINISQTEQLECYLRLHSGKIKRMIIPSSVNGMKIRLEKLIDAINRMPDKQTFNLTFDGTIVCK